MIVDNTRNTCYPQAVNTLVAWLGMKDLAGIGQSDEDEQGPVARALRAIDFEQLSATKQR